MKVLFIASLPPPITGQSVAVQALLDQLRAEGHSVAPINQSKNTFRQGINSLSRVFEVLWLTWRTWRAGTDFDAVYLTTSESLAGNLKDMLLLAVLGKLQCKTWLHLHGGALMRQLLIDRTGLVGRINSFFLPRVAGLIVLGERHVSMFDGYVRPDRIKIVKNFAPDEAFVDADHVTKKWSNTSTLRVLFLSNLLPGKGYKELLQAIANLPESLTARFTFDFAGGFETKADERNFMTAIAKHTSVQYHGVVEGKFKQQLLARSHIFCLPSHYEGQPISILEAYAAGCAVLTTNRGGTFDIFTPDQNGLEIFAHNPVSIIDALKYLAANPEYGAEFAQNNRRLADQNYTRKHHLGELLALLSSKGNA